MENFPVVVRNTFIEVERPADPTSARRSSSLPHMWRCQEYADSSISACTSLAIANADDQTETTQINSQSSADTGRTCAPSTGKTEKPMVPRVPLSLFQKERNECAMRLNALDLFVSAPRRSKRVGMSAIKIPPKEFEISARSSNVRSRSRSANSDRSKCSDNSLCTKTTGCGSGSDIGSATSDGGSAHSPTNAVRADGVTPPPSPNETNAVTQVSGSRRSRRRRAAARRAAEAEQGKLRIHAPPFQPVSPPVHQACLLSKEMFDMVSVAQASVLSCPHVLSVQIVKPVPPETKQTSIVVSFHPGKVWEHDVRTLAKNAFLEAVEKSEQVFILGYDVEPFVDENNKGFTATIGSVPVDHQRAVCWDFWQKGFCQRLSTCRWCHPVSSDLMDVKFVFEPAQVPAQMPAQQLHPSLSGPVCHVNSWCVPVGCWMACSA